MTALRYLRLKYGITLSELAEGIPLSQQNLNHIELLDIKPTPRHEALAQQALRTYIARTHRKLDALECELQLYHGRLLQPVQEVNENGI